MEGEKGGRERRPQRAREALWRSRNLLGYINVVLPDNLVELLSTLRFRRRVLGECLSWLDPAMAVRDITNESQVPNAEEQITGMLRSRSCYLLFFHESRFLNPLDDYPTVHAITSSVSAICAIGPSPPSSSSEQVIHRIC